jgi:ribosome maturation factor RimP
MNARKNFTGILRELKESVVMLDEEGALVAIALDNIAKAKLVPEAINVERRRR